MQCDAYEPYRLHTAEEQMSDEEMLQQLRELRCMFLGSRRSMALGIALERLTKTETHGE